MHQVANVGNSRVCHVRIPWAKRNERFEPLKKFTHPSSRYILPRLTALYYALRGFALGHEGEGRAIFD
jgi:hypothetical protein